MFNTQRICMLTAAIAIAATTGCASLFNDRTQMVTVATSNGKSIPIVVDGVPYQAPGIVMMNRAKNPKIITTTDQDCAKLTMVEPELDSWFWGDVIALSVLSTTVDYATEKMWSYQENIVLSCSQQVSGI